MWASYVAPVIAFISRALPYLNPLNWIQVLMALKGAWDIILAIITAATEWKTKRDQQKQLDEVRRAEDALSDASKIEDKDERLKRKKEAACDMEKSFNPDADC